MWRFKKNLPKYLLNPSEIKENIFLAAYYTA